MSKSKPIRCRSLTWKEYFGEIGRGSCFGDYLYDQIVPENHFLCELKQQTPRKRFTHRLLELYKGGGMYSARPMFRNILFSGFHLKKIQ